jgi:hypothetical protein
MLINIHTYIYDFSNNDACNYKVIMCRIDPNGELHTHLCCEPVVLWYCQLVVSECCCVFSESLNQHLDVSIFKSLLFKKKIKSLLFLVGPLLNLRIISSHLSTPHISK